MQSRYQSLQLHDAISRREDYAEACRELRCILRAAYAYAPNAFQAQLYEDVLLAFRSLPGMEDSRQLDAARALLGTAEALFSNKRLCASAVHEFETAATARQQRHKNPETPPERMSLSRDTLLLVFKFLDARSLATASAVCREWNVVATDNTLWHALCLYYFKTPNLGAKIADQGSWKKHLEKIPEDNSPGVWRKAFSFTAKGGPSHLLTSNRARCSVCRDVMWCTEPPWRPAVEQCASSKRLQCHSPRPMSVGQVVLYMVSRDTASSNTDLEEQ